MITLTSSWSSSTTSSLSNKRNNSHYHNSSASVRSRHVPTPSPVRCCAAPSNEELFNMVQQQGLKLQQQGLELEEIKRQAARSAVPRIALTAFNIQELVYGLKLWPVSPSPKATGDKVTLRKKGERLSKATGVSVESLDAARTFVNNKMAHFKTQESLDIEVAALQPYLPVLQKMMDEGTDAFILQLQPSRGFQGACTTLARYQDIKEEFITEFRSSEGAAHN